MQTGGTDVLTDDGAEVKSLDVVCMVVWILIQLVEIDVRVAVDVEPSESGVVEDVVAEMPFKANVNWTGDPARK